MKRFNVSLLLLGCLVAAHCAGSVSAAEKPVLPKGLRVLFDGNSWFKPFVPDCVADQVKAAGIQGHKELLAKPGDLNPATSPIAAGEVDVYMHCIHWWSWAFEQGGRDFEAAKVVEMGLKANPDFRAYYEAAWLVHDGVAIGFKNSDEQWKAFYDGQKLADVQAALDKERTRIEPKADEINQKYGKAVVFIVPVGDAVIKLRALMLEGKYPGVTKQSDLWLDHMPHPGVHVKVLSGYCNFAAIYRMSPVGLKISCDRNAMRPTGEKDLTDEQHAILQKIAWETVSKYPYAGIAKAKASGSPKEVANPAGAGPAAGADSTAVPNALKGWKVAPNLPNDSVLTDYNNYIEKLPKAERPGVADVRYYVDGTGRYAVTILVNAGGKQWTHLLIYDKENKRIETKKLAE